MALEASAHARGHDIDGEMQRLRQLSMKYIREAERLEREHATERKDSEQISAALDAIARDFLLALFKMS